MDQPFVDAHVHFWDPAHLRYPWLDHEPDLQRSFLPDDLAATHPTPHEVVFVQADCLPDQGAAEVAWVQGLASRGAPVAGIVAHAPLERGRSVAGWLDRLGAAGLVVGVRRLLQDERPGFALDTGFVDGVRLLADRGLTFDVCIRHHQFAEIVELVERCPDVTFVLDHLGKPEVGRADFGAWADDLARLAASPRVHCKLSGLGTEAEPMRPNSTVVGPYLRHALQVFGPARCMFGSDWPVVGTVMSYGSWYDLVQDALEGLSVLQRDQVMGGTARAVYLRGDEGVVDGTDR